MTKLTSRDRKLLCTIGACQVLATSQVHRWHFGNVSLNMAQKRLRKLVEAGYLDSMETKVCTDNLLVLGIVAFVGACILLFLFRMIFRRGMVRT